MEYLSTSRSIYDKIQTLFSTDNKKWAIVAFVGSNPAALLPKNIKNLQVICWPLAGGTHPDGIRQLIKEGIEVSFCNDMHIKLFYSEGIGAILGSANLSANALRGKQNELCVFLNDTSFDIQSLLNEISPIVPVNSENLTKLDIEHNRYNRNNPSKEPTSSDKPVRFQEAMSMKFPKKWKLVTYNGDLNRAEINELENDLLTNFSSTQRNNYNGITEGHFQAGDFVLQVEIKEGDGAPSRKKPRWLLVDHVAKISSTKVIVEIRETHQLDQPFLIDRDFVNAFKLAFKTKKLSALTDTRGYVTEEFINLISSKYANLSI